MAPKPTRKVQDVELPSVDRQRAAQEAIDANHLEREGKDNITQGDIHIFHDDKQTQLNISQKELIDATRLIVPGSSEEFQTQFESLCQAMRDAEYQEVVLSLRDIYLRAVGQLEAFLIEGIKSSSPEGQQLAAKTAISHKIGIIIEQLKDFAGLCEVDRPTKNQIRYNSVKAGVNSVFDNFVGYISPLANLIGWAKFGGEVIYDKFSLKMAPKDKVVKPSFYQNTKDFISKNKAKVLVGAVIGAGVAALAFLFPIVLTVIGIGVSVGGLAVAGRAAIKNYREVMARGEERKQKHEAMVSAQEKFLNPTYNELHHSTDLDHSRSQSAELINLFSSKQEAPIRVATSQQEEPLAQSRVAAAPASAPENNHSPYGEVEIADPDRDTYKEPALSANRRSPGARPGSSDGG